MNTEQTVLLQVAGISAQVQVLSHLVQALLVRSCVSQADVDAIFDPLIAATKTPGAAQAAGLSAEAGPALMKMMAKHFEDMKASVSSDRRGK